jgi:energy-coupling factor transporter transmembrane protein EcfT
MDQQPSSTFGLYETVRILIPGFYFSTLLLFFVLCFAGSLTTLFVGGSMLLLVFLFVAVVSGLTMYAKETTKRRKAFVENQPSNFLKEHSKTLRDTELLDDDSARKLYFYLLNHHVPASFHDKIFFFGTIYHIMILLRRTTFWFAIASLTGILIQFAAGKTYADQASSILFAAVVWLIYLLNVRYNKADRKMQENYQDQIFWLEMNQDLVESTIKQFTRSRSKHSK